MGENVPPLEENTDLSEFNLERAQLLLRLFYGDYLHQNNGLYLERGFTEDAIWQRRWIRLAAQSASWFATPSGVVGRCFTDILAAEWQGFLVGVGNPRDPLYSSTSFLHLESAGPGISGR